MTERVDVLVIGAGQAGLAMGRELAARGLRFAIVDGAPAIGHSWRTRWDSLTLFTPARYSALPGLPFPGDPERYPGKDDVADYLEAYARRFELPVRLSEPVYSLRRQGEEWLAITSRGEWRAAQVVVATGPFQRPARPALADRLGAGVTQLHSADYRRPHDVAGEAVAVVGGGNSGVQIAAELAASGRRVSLALGSAGPVLPQRLLGRSLFWWLERTGLMGVSVETRFGRRAAGQNPLIGEGPRAVARRLGVRPIARAVGADGDTLVTAAGERLVVDAVVWATGFHPDYAWIDAPVFDEAGRPVHRRGVTAEPGLYFLGLPWQHTRGSALIGWVGADARYCAEAVSAYAPVSPGSKLLATR